MATVYEMMLKVGAQLSSSFGNTFSTAQKNLIETQKEIQNLSKQQSNISAYQKQEAAMAKCLKQQDTYRAQISNLKRELQALTKENGQHAAGTSELANKILDLERKLSSAAEQEEKNREALKNMGKELKDAGINTKALGDEIDKIQGKIGDLKKKQDETAESSEELGDKGANAFKEVGEALAAAGILKMLKEGYDLMVDLTKGSASYADEIGTVSVQYSIAAEDLQAFYYAAELVDVSAETLTSTMSRNIRAMNSARDGTESYVEAYEKLGIKVTDADGQLRDSETVYWEVIDALGAMENETERDAVAIELLGRSAQQVNTLVAAGSGVIKEYAAEAKRAGYVMNDETLAACMALDDELQKQNSNMTALKNTVGGQLAPMYTKLKEVENEALVALTGFVDEHPELVRGVTAGATVMGTATAGFVAFTGIVTKVIPLLKGLGVAMSSAIPGIGPILAITAVIAGLAGIVEATVSEAEDATAIYKDLTATSRKQAIELDALKAEYQALTEVEGENTYEAWLLEEQIKSLTEEYEASRQTAEAHKEELISIAKILNATSEEYEKNIESIDNEYESSIALINKLEELGMESETVAGKQALIKPIVDELNSRYENLGLTIDSITGKLNIPTEKLRELAAAEAAKDTNKADWDNYVDNVGYIGAYSKDYEDAIKELQSLKDEYDESEKALNDHIKANETNFNMTDDDLRKFNEESYRLAEVRDKAKKAWEDYRDIHKSEEDGIIFKYEKALRVVEEFEEKYEGMSRSAVEASGDMISKVEELGKSYIEIYQEIYDAAYESITGQFALWDNAADVVPKSIEDINNALATQAAYWSDYNKDMSELLDRGEDIDGLAEVIASFADGSPDSVNAIAGMAAASDEELRLMVGNYSKMKEQQDEAAKSLAQATSEELQAIEKQMRETVEELNLSEEMEVAAKASMDAYINALLEGSEEAADILNDLASVFGKKEIQWEKQNSHFENEWRTWSMLPSGYASGTDYASPGVHIVGENGPEIIDFGGGEAVYNAIETERMLRTLINTYNSFSSDVLPSSLSIGNSAGRVEISISPIFNISGDENAADKLEEYGDIIADKVLEKLSEIGIDAKRGAFV
ncbi:MAG: hypothetical protein E7671_00530 [Ruminococcaceae bacterium]|nr:hypothetical protein [Oscillospiraceae bacterium]